MICFINCLIDSDRLIYLFVGWLVGLLLLCLLACLIDRLIDRLIDFFTSWN